MKSLNDKTTLKGEPIVIIRGYPEPYPTFQGLQCYQESVVIPWLNEISANLSLAREAQENYDLQVEHQERLKRVLMTLKEYVWPLE